MLRRAPLFSLMGVRNVDSLVPSLGHYHGLRRKMSNVDVRLPSIRRTTLIVLSRYPPRTVVEAHCCTLLFLVDVGVDHER